MLPAEVILPAGSFLMGSASGQPDERPVHRVWLDSFALAIYPVTNAEYARFLSATGYPASPFWETERFNRPDQPVVGPSWYAAVAFCEWLSRETGGAYRLPTEAEREYATRGGREGLQYPWGDDDPAWEGVYTLGKAGADRPHPIGSTPPNDYGLYHLHDNVHEWCSDWYDPEYYAVSPERNPTGPASGRRRASRGGAWRHHVKISTNAHRSSLLPDHQYNDYGFRVARTLEG